MDEGDLEIEAYCISYACNHDVWNGSLGETEHEKKENVWGKREYIKVNMR